MNEISLFILVIFHANQEVMHHSPHEHLESSRPQRPQWLANLMRQILTFCILFFCVEYNFVKSEDHETGAERVALDLTNPDSSSVDVFTRRPYNIVTRLYVPKKGYKVVSVKDGRNLVCTFPTGHSCDHIVVTLKDDGSPGFANVYLRDKEDARNVLYFKKVDSEWVSVTEENFYDDFYQMMLKEVTFESIDLDIDQNDTSKLYINGSPKFPFAVYTPKVGYRINEVMDGSTIIWSATSDEERCIYASFYPRETPILAYLLISSDHGMHELYLHKNGSWNEVTREHYLDEVSEAGLDPSTFSNKVTMDIRDVDRDIFQPTIYPVHKRKYHLYIPHPGFTLVRVVDGHDTLWEASDGDYCLHVNISEINGAHRMCYLFVYGPKTGRRVLYLKKDKTRWKLISRSEYLALFTERADPMYTHEGDGKIMMSSFRNRQGLKIATYSATVDSSKGDIILVHGIRGNFTSDFCTSNMEWNYGQFGYDLSPAASPLGGYTAPVGPPNASKYKYFFENLLLHGDLMELSPRYEYEGSFVEALNQLGYNVYGLDLQSLGLSDSAGDLRCHVHDFKDYIYDVIQFISIIRRGKFSDTTETWNEETTFSNHHTGRKTILHANSMGGNVALQTVQEFYRHAKPGTPFVDGVIVASTMLNLDCHIKNWKMEISRMALKYIVMAITEIINPYEEFYDYGSHFEPFSRYYDPLQYIHKTTFGTLNSLFEACDDVNKNMAHYPMSLPTLLIHSRDDFICDAKGPRDLMENYFKGNKNVNYVELEGNFHFLGAPESISAVMPHIWNWLNGLSSKQTTKVQESDEF